VPSNKKVNNRNDEKNDKESNNKDAQDKMLEESINKDTWVEIPHVENVKDKISAKNLFASKHKIEDNDKTPNADIKKVDVDRSLKISYKNNNNNENLTNNDQHNSIANKDQRRKKSSEDLKKNTFYQKSMADKEDKESHDTILPNNKGYMKVDEHNECNDMDSIVANAMANKDQRRKEALEDLKKKKSLQKLLATNEDKESNGIIKTSNEGFMKVDELKECNDKDSTVATRHIEVLQHLKDKRLNKDY
jgi:hypothetical protein